MWYTYRNQYCLQLVTGYNLYSSLYTIVSQFAIIFIILTLVPRYPGICSIGNLSLRNLRLFVIMPSLFYLAVGVCFLLAGFVSLFRIRNVIKNQVRLITLRNTWNIYLSFLIFYFSFYKLIVIYYYTLLFPFLYVFLNKPSTLL